MLITACNSEGEAIFDAEDSCAWEEFVSAAPSATISHLYGWRRIIPRAYGHRTFYLIARRGNATTGILPLVHIKSRLLGNSLSSMPFQDYGGIIGNDAAASQALLNYALHLKNELKAASLELRHRDFPFPNEGKLRQDKATLILDISTGTDSLWKTFSPKLRNQIRKAQKSGLSTQSGGPELLEEFYRPFAANMRDLGSPVHHPRFFEEIFSEFGNNARVLIIGENKQTIGGLIALFHHNTIIIPWASCFRQYFPKCPNNLLYWEAIQYACSRGCTSLDFGRSTINSGTYNFKLQWGAHPVQLHWQVFSENDRKSPAERNSLRMASAIWKHIPLGLATSLGPHLRKYLTN